MANQNIKVRVTSEHESTRYFYVQVQAGQGDEGSSYIYVGSTENGGSVAESSEFSTSKLFDGSLGFWSQYLQVTVYASTQEVNLTGSVTSSNFGTILGVIDNKSYGMDHPDAPGSLSSPINANTYYLDMTYPDSDVTGSGWGSWTQSDSSGNELDLVGPSSMTASFTGATNTSVKLVFNESPRDSSGDMWTLSTIPSISMSNGFSWSPSNSTIKNFEIESVAYSTTTNENDTVTLGISFDGTVGADETLSFTLAQSVVYDANQNQAGSGSFSSGDLSWPTTGGSGRTYYDRTFKLTNTHSGTVYFIMGVDNGEGLNSGSYVQLGSVASNGTTSFTVSQVKMNDFAYSEHGGSGYYMYAYDSDQSGNINNSWWPTGTSAYITPSYLNTATDGRIEWSWDGSSWAGPTIYDTNGSLVDVAVSTPTTTFANSSGSGTVTVDYGEKIYRKTSGWEAPTSFSELSELSTSDISMVQVTQWNNDGQNVTDVSNIGDISLSYATSDDSGAMAIYGTDSTSNNYGTGWFYPVYLADPGSSHQHTFSQYSGTTFYMPNANAYHAQSNPPAGYVHYHDQVVVSFTYSGTASASDNIMVNTSVSTVYDASLNSGSFSPSGNMEADSSSSSSQGDTDMTTRLNIGRLSVSADLKPDSDGGAALGTASKQWSDLRLSDTIYLSAASKISINDVVVTPTAAELNVLASSGLAASDMSTLATLALDGVAGLAQTDFTKLAALEVTAVELNLLEAVARGSIVYGNASGETALLAKGGANTLLFSDGDDIAYGQLTNAMISSSAAIDLDKLDWTSASGSAITDFAQNDYMIIYDLSETAPVKITMSSLEDAIFGNITGGDISGAAEGVLTIDDSSVVTDKIAAGAVTLAKMAADSVDGSKIADESIDSEHYVDGSIDSDHFAAGAVDTDALGADAVTGAKIADESIDSDHFVDGSIDSAHFAAGAVDTDALGADAVTNAKMADNSVDSDQYVDGSVDNVHLAGSITADKMNNAIFADLETLGAPTADGEFMVASDAGVFAYESGNTARTSLGLGTGDSPSFTNLTVSGTLTVEGSTTTIESSTLAVDDKNIELGTMSSSEDDPTDTTANGGGITLKGATDKTFNWVVGTSSWTSSEHLDLAENKELKINGTKVLDADGSAKVGSGVAGNGLEHNSGSLSVELDGGAASGLSVGSDGVKVSEGGIATAMLAADAVTPAKMSLFDDTLAAGDKKILIGDGSDYSEFVLSGDVTMTNAGVVSIGALKVLTAMINNDAVTGAKIADESIDSDHYVDGSIDSDHFAAGAVDTDALGADAVTGAKIADESIDSDHFVDGSIDSAHFAAGAVDTDALGADSVTGAKIADESIDSDHFVDGSIDTAHFAAGSVDTTALGADAVTGAKVADDAIDSEHIADGAIDTAHIGAAQVTKAKLASDVAGTGIQFDGGELSISMVRSDFTKKDTTAVGSTRTLTVSLGAGNDAYIANSLQVFHNGMLMRLYDSTIDLQPDGSADGFGDYTVAAVSSNEFVITLRAIDNADPMPDDDDTISVFLIVQ